MELKLELDVPTSLNKLYINQSHYNPKSKKYVPTGKRILSKEGKQSKNALQANTRVQMKGQEWDYSWTEEDNNFLYMDTVIYFARRGTDENNIYKLLCDALEGIAYDNDSKVLTRTQKIMYNPNNPRIEVTLKPVSFYGIFDSKEEFVEFENRCSTCTRYRNGSCKILNDVEKGTEKDEVVNKVCQEYKEKKK